MRVPPCHNEEGQWHVDTDPLDSHPNPSGAPSSPLTRYRPWEPPQEPEVSKIPAESAYGESPPSASFSNCPRETLPCSVVIQPPFPPTAVGVMAPEMTAQQEGA